MDKSIDIKEQIREIIDKSSLFNSLDFSNKNKISHQEVVGVLKSMEMSETVILTRADMSLIELTDDGKEILKNGSPNIRLLTILSKSSTPLPKSQLETELSKELYDRAFSSAMKLKQITFDKTKLEISMKAGTKFDVDEAQTDLALFESNPNPSKHDAKKITLYKKDKSITVVNIVHWIANKGPNYDMTTKFETDLTANLLTDDNWKNFKFKPYNFKAKGKEQTGGALHPLLKVRTQYREMLLELGFQEMPTNCFVESSFWNFDSLFQPQQHPARDSHDTFFLINPKYSKLDEKYSEYFKRVKEIHEIGGHGSIGWNYNWSAEEANKNLLRTHTTAVSAKMLYKLAEDYKKSGVFKPTKLFSIDRVFRNETLDKTHLAEFHQIEGVLADRNIGLGHLIGTIEDFFHRMGIKNLRFKPTFNPYTEPSMELYAYHDKLKKWVEIGNSGIFRPEMLLPMGLPSGVQVIAWGLSLERPTMIHYGIDNIRDLFGHEVKISDTRKSSVYCLLNKA